MSGNKSHKLCDLLIERVRTGDSTNWDEAEARNQRVSADIAKLRDSMTPYELEKAGRLFQTWFRAYLRS